MFATTNPLMNSKHRPTRIALTIAATVSLLSGVSAVQAEGWYVGADVVAMNTSIDYDAGSERYGTNHLRAKLGYAYNDYFSLEARIMSSGDDTDQNASNVKFRWQTGSVVSFYLRPTVPVGKFNFYGLIGLSVLDTTYTDTATSQADAERVRTLDYGLGAEYYFTRNFSISLEAKAFTGTADYSKFFTPADSVTVSGTTVGLGTVFRF